MEVARQTQANRDKRIVAGLGSTGLSCARHLHAHGVPFVVVDSRAQPPGLAALCDEMPGVEFIPGENPEGIFDGVGELVVSPGIAMDAPIVGEALASGVDLKDGITRPAGIDMVDEPAWLWPRNPPIRRRRNIPTQWLRVEIREGRNRQLRRMTAAVGYPTLRLVRIGIADWTLDGLEPGEYRMLQ